MAKALANDSCRTVVVACHGGVPIAQQAKQIEDALEQHLIVAATPGRWLDLLQQCGDIDPPETIVLDEADRLASSSDHCQQVGSILAKHCSNKSARMILVSATWPSKVTDQWKQWLSMVDKKRPETRPCVVLKEETGGMHYSEAGTDVVDSEAAVESDEATKPEAPSDATQPTVASPDEPLVEDCFSLIPSHVIQTLHVCAQHKKPAKLMKTLQKLEEQQGGQRGIVFFQKIKTLQFVSHFLQKKGISNMPLHGQMSWKDRQEALQRFASERTRAGGHLQLLLASDVAARGLDVARVGFVVNYDFPTNLEQYVHRCGRAGRGWSTKQDSSKLGQRHGSTAGSPWTVG